jgi:hypothetical protein
MKRFLFLFFTMLALGVMSVAAQGQDTSQTGSMADITAFTGIIAAVSLIGTQAFKLIPVIEYNAWLKILLSVIVGILVTFISWRFSLATFLIGIQWWQALVYGAGAGLLGCGMFDVLKALLPQKDDFVELE